MLLALDIGNTNITAGVFKGDSLKCFRRIKTGRTKTPDEYRRLFLKALKKDGLRASDIDATIVCSVVPRIDRAVASALRGLTKTRPLFVGRDIKPGIRVSTDNPAEVGADRIVNAVAATRLHRPPLIIVDLGTASTFDYIAGDGSYRGGAIAPGIGISAEALFEKTAKLPRIRIRRPQRVIGRDTVSAMESGLYWGSLGLIDGVIERMKREIKGKPAVIATGGFSALIKGRSRFIDEYDEFLTLKGLKFIYEGEEP